MKKSILILGTASAFALGTVLISGCSNSGDSQKDTTHEHMEGEHEHAQVAYICPMKCEGSESNEPGKCPVCKMDLVKVEGETDVNR